MTRLTWLLPLFFVTLVGSSLLVLTFAGAQLPVGATNILSAIGFVPFLPLMPLLEALGLTGSGELFGPFPTFGGVVVGLLLWALLLAAVGRAISALIKR